MLILNSLYLGKSVDMIRTSFLYGTLEVNTSIPFMDAGALEVNTSIPNFKNETSLWSDFY